MNQSTSADIDQKRANQALPPPLSSAAFRRDAWLLGIAWFGTSLVMSLTYPLRNMLKEELKLDALQLSWFFGIAAVSIYIKPIAGLIADAVPLFGTRRRHWLLVSLTAAAALYILLGTVPRTYGNLLSVQFGIMCTMTMVSTVLGGYMVEVGKRENATGRLSAQRTGVSSIVGLISGPAGGRLANVPLFFTTGISSVLSVFLVVLFYRYQREPRAAQRNTEVWHNARHQLKAIVRARTVWVAGALTVLVIMAPGFGTALFYHAKDNLKFSNELLGDMGVIGSLGGVFGAWSYGRVCKRLRLRTLMFLGTAINGLLTLLFLKYQTVTWAMIITATESISGVWAILPLYDLAARATPRGSEALGYSVMMSIWNLTGTISDLIGSWLYSRWGLTIQELIWVNTATTLAVLLIIPLLPAVLMDRKDGDESHVESSPASSG